MSLVALLFSVACGSGAASSDAESAAVQVETATVVGATPTVVADPATAVAANATPTATAQVATPTVAPAPTPTVEPEPLSDDDLIAMAVAAYRGQPASADPVGVDLLEGVVLDDRRIELRLCQRSGDSVFDAVHTVTYEIASDPSDGAALTLLDDTIAGEDCLNDALMQSVLAFSREFDAYFVDVSADPAGFAADPRSREVLTDRAYIALEAFFAPQAGDQLSTEFTDHEQPLPEAAIADILWRRYETDGTEYFGLMACREMNPAYGEYRDGTLVDDGRTENSVNTHGIIEYIFTPDATIGEWQLYQFNGLIWADCLATGDWVAAANEWQTEPVGWQPWQN